MLDGVMRRIIDPTLASAGQRLARYGVSADSITLAGFASGLLCSLGIVFSCDFVALVLLGIGRVSDGLDGAVARATRITDRGGFLDITCDFIFYGSVPLAFALRDPTLFAMPSAVLLAAFYANGASFLAFSALAAKRCMSTQDRGIKSLYFTTGLMEGTETILFFVAFIMFPAWFAPLAYVFAALCGLTCVARIILGWHIFGVDDGAE